MKRSAALGIIAATLLVLACDQSDDTVTNAVKTRLAENTALKASQVNIASEGGVVTLTGTVASQADKEQAVQIARGATGVSDVVDNLKVQDAATTSGTAASAGAEPAAAASSPATEAEAGGTAHGVGAAVGGALKTAEEATVAAGKTTGTAVSDAAVATGHAAEKGGKAVGGAAKSFGAGVKEGVTGGGKK
jgi:BON domain